MPQEILLLTILLAIFTIIVTGISIILLIQILKSEKEARGFLFNLFLYFLLLAIANIQQVIYNILNLETLILSPDLQIYTTFFVFLLTLAAPIYLIFQIEKIFFPNSKITFKYHLFAIIILILFIVFLIDVTYSAIIDMGVIINFQLMDFVLIAMPLLGLEILFILFSFLYLGIKSSGKYRQFSFIVSLGWLLNYAVNTVATLALFSLLPSTIVILFIPKLFGVILTAWGLYRLYALKSR